MWSEDKDWSEDEMLVVLEHYFAEPSKRANTDAAVVALARLLGRSASSVSRRLANYLDRDPSTSKRGLSHGGQHVDVVFFRYFEDRNQLAIDASAARQRLAQRRKLHEGATAYEPPIEDIEFVEGGKKRKLHLAVERNQTLVRRAKEEFAAKHGRLYCEICSFDFRKRYGKVGVGFIEAHHILPIATLTGKTVARISDLMMVCPNCHRMLHRGKQPPTADRLRKMLR